MAASWECPAMPMISLALKETAKSSFLALKPLISAHYEESSESFEEEIKQLDRLREAASKPSRDYPGCNVLRRYYSQLHLLHARFPHEMVGQIPIDFVWKDVYTGAEYCKEGLQIELASVLYNIGALHSLVGSRDGRHDEQEMKEALTHYQCSAGAFAYLHERFGNNGCADMNPQLMEMYKTLQLGQAQECIVEKSLKGLSKVKNLNISRVSMKVAEYYQFVVLVLESNPPVTKKHKDWMKLIQVKSSYYLAIAHLYQANSLEEQGNYGHMIAFQQLALQKLTEMGKLPRGLPDVVKEGVKHLMEYINARLQQSQKQNDQVYHELVPSLDTLEYAPGVELVKPVVFQPVDKKMSGSDIFARLVPMKAYEVASVYSEEKAKILRSILSSVDQKDSELENYMRSLNPDEVDKLSTGPPAIPSHLMDQHRQFQSKSDSIKAVQENLEQLVVLSQRVEEQVSAMVERREVEEQEEKDYQAKYGARPESQVCAALWKELDSLHKYHKQANKSNGDLRTMFNKHRHNLQLLSGPTPSLVAATPTLTLLDTPAQDVDVDRWKQLLAKVDEMKQQRKQFVSKLREQMKSDDITRELIGEMGSAGGGQDSVIEEHLQPHRQVAELIRQNLTAQENILRVLTELNAKQAKFRQASQELTKSQEDWYIQLAKSAGSFKFLQSKIEEGVGFYSKLADSVTRLYKSCIDVCNSRRKQRQSVEKRHSPSPPPPPRSTKPAVSDSNQPPPPSSSAALPPNRPPKKAELRGEPIQHPETQTTLPYQNGSNVNHQQTEQPETQQVDISELTSGGGGSDSMVQLLMNLKSTQEQQMAALNMTTTIPNGDDATVHQPPEPTATPVVPPASLMPGPTTTNSPTPPHPSSQPSFLPPPPQPSLPQPSPLPPSQSPSLVSPQPSSLPSSQPSLQSSPLPPPQPSSLPPLQPPSQSSPLPPLQSSALPSSNPSPIPTSLSTLPSSPPPQANLPASLSPATNSEPDGVLYTPLIPPRQTDSSSQVLTSLTTNGPTSFPPDPRLPSPSQSLPPLHQPVPPQEPVSFSPVPPSIPTSLPSSLKDDSSGASTENSERQSPHFVTLPDTSGGFNPPQHMNSSIVSSYRSLPNPVSSENDGDLNAAPQSLPEVPSSSADQPTPHPLGEKLQSEPRQNPLDFLDVFGKSGSSNPPTPPPSAHSDQTSSTTPKATDVITASITSPLLASNLPIIPQPQSLPQPVISHPPSLAAISPAASPSSLFHSSPQLEGMLVKQQDTINTQSRQLEEQKTQLQHQYQMIETQKSELEQIIVQNKLQEEKTSSSNNQAMLMQLLQQQQEMFAQQQSQLDKMNQVGEMQRKEHLDTMSRLQQSLTQEQLRVQNLQGQVSQKEKEAQHLQHQLQLASQQIQATQTQAQQYAVQLQERDKLLTSYREEHKKIIDGMEQQYRQRMNQLTQQLQELQTELRVAHEQKAAQASTAMPPPNALPLPLRPQTVRPTGPPPTAIPSQIPPRPQAPPQPQPGWQGQGANLPPSSSSQSLQPQPAQRPVTNSSQAQPMGQPNANQPQWNQPPHGQQVQPPQAWQEQQASRMVPQSPGQHPSTPTQPPQLHQQLPMQQQQQHPSPGANLPPHAYARTPQQHGNMPGMPQQHGNMPGMPQQHGNVPGVPQQHRNVPGVPQQHGNMPGVPQQHGNMPGVPQQHGNMPGVPQQHGNMPGVPQQHGNMPGVSQQHRNMPGVPQQHGNMPGVPQQHGNMPGVLQQHGNMPGVSQQHRNMPGVPQQHGNMPGVPQQHGNMPGVPQQHGNMPGVPQQHGNMPGVSQQYGNMPGIPQQHGNMPQQHANLPGVPQHHGNVPVSLPQQGNVPGLPPSHHYSRQL